MKKFKIEYFTIIRVLSKLLGLWPRKPNQCRFFLSLVCIMLRVTLEVIDLFNWIHDLEYAVKKFMELIGYTDILIMMLILKINISDLQWILSRIEDDFDRIEDLNFEQQKIFKKYYNLTNKFVKVITPCLITLSFIHYLSPLANQVKNIGYSTFVYQLPHRSLVHFVIKNPVMYAIVYICQFPALLISCLMRAANDSMLISMTFHACGQLCVLRFQINNLKKTHLKKLSQIIDKHIYIIEYTQVLKRCFQLVLFNQLIQGTISLAITGYFTLWHLKQDKMFDFAAAVGYGLFTTAMLFMYSWLGQSLINENEKLFFAFYNSNWLEMPYRQARVINISLIVARNSLHLMTINIFVFSMSGFAKIMQTAFAYMSILHKVD